MYRISLIFVGQRIYNTQALCTRYNNNIIIYYKLILRRQVLAMCFNMWITDSLVCVIFEGEKRCIVRTGETFTVSKGG